MCNYNIQAAGEAWKRRIDTEWLKLTDREWTYRPEA